MTKSTWTLLTALLLGVELVSAAPGITSSSTPVSVTSLTPVSVTSLTPVSVTSSTPVSVTISTAIASASVPAATLPSQVPLPPVQAWCPSQIFCAGSLLQTVNIAEVFVDSKTFVDKPTSKTPQNVLQDFASINGSTPTYEQVVNFVSSDFKGEGLELEAQALAGFNPNPAFLNNVSDPLVKGFAGSVHGIWNQLIRDTNDSVLCADGTCESTLIPLNHTFVVPGGRFREQYYWDSFWIVEGLIQSELYDTVKSTLENFMDEIEKFGFIPNGGRIYYLNRSQPPLFIQMLSLYVKATKDTSILERALPLAEAELKWWATNRTVSVTSSFTNTTYQMARFAAINTAPRPESYLEDYNTANGEGANLTEAQRSDLYAELASGAETGWDYTSRYMSEPLSGNATDTDPALRSLRVRETIPICLNSILYQNHIVLAELYASSNKTAADSHRSTAATIKAGVLDLFWDSNKLAFYDYNTTSNARNSIYTAANFYPLWNGIVPDELKTNSSKAFGYFASLNMILNRYNGTIPSTFLTTGLQWDAPNAWPPHQYIALKALQALPSNVTSSPLPVPSSGQNTFSLVPSGQLGLTEDLLPLQPITNAGNASASGAGADISTLNGTVVNGGNATEGEGWGNMLQRELANRYITSAFCSWYATGGSIPGLLPQRPTNELNVTNSVGNSGNMFEKFSNLDVDNAGSGGEYTVQAGFGWTNGVVLWVAAEYGDILVSPTCPNPLDTASGTNVGTSDNAGFRSTAGVFGWVVAAGVGALLL